MVPYETHTKNGYTIHVVYDETPDDFANPRQGDGNLGVFLACNHLRYTLGDASRADEIDEYHQAEAAFRHFAERRLLRAFPRWAKIFLGATAVLPVYLHDHSILSVRAGRDFSDSPYGRWDSGLLGFIFDTPRTREGFDVRADVAEALKDEVDLYNLFLTGQVFGYEILDVNGDHVDSCYGFLGAETARDAGLEAVPDEPVEKLYTAHLTPQQLDVLGLPYPTIPTRLTAEQLAALSLPVPGPTPLAEHLGDPHTVPVFWQPNTRVSDLIRRA